MPLPLDHNSSKMIIIISLLNELEEDQASGFRKMGLSATAMNGEKLQEQPNLIKEVNSASIGCC
ncbi:uncharacterized protein LAESUDRAFT_761986 [Laetiporus sulphureus 93-53]|uniref:Uncharacterized protein n=1 Tax=Laetiporus sulphureus 93-53 TaxID=1314785 RepID=A0A165CTI5_9APHY|nr:uncharacterized protein LAESUDRAFT_761986 [Laetiporus sulphureus 93-53]KZT03410.1 hypothetical protein LAESUDRAFT_761986 [Laetiporus sulphureus 93-53]